VSWSLWVYGSRQPDTAELMRLAEGVPGLRAEMSGPVVQGWDGDSPQFEANPARTVDPQDLPPGVELEAPDLWVVEVCTKTWVGEVDMAQEFAELLAEAMSGAMYDDASSQI